MMCESRKKAIEIPINVTCLQFQLGFSVRNGWMRFALVNLLCGEWRHVIMAKYGGYWMGVVGQKL